MVFLIGCLLTGQALAVGYIDYDLPLPDEYYDSWGGLSSGFDNSWGVISPDFNYSWGNSSSGFGEPSVSASVPTPVITRQPDPYLGTKGEIPVALRVDVSSFDGGFLRYQWYMSYSGTYEDRYAIDGAYSFSYTPNQILGTAYYFVGVSNVNGQLCSEEVYSNIVPVTYAGIQITNAPYKLHYTVGSSVDLSGLAVTVYDGYSTSWQSYNGSGLNVYPSVFSSVGRVAVEVSYNGSSDVFYVNVDAGGSNSGTLVKNSDGTVTAQNGAAVAEDGSHVHSFGDWEVTKPATCITTGIETRKCECGETETRDIARTEHTWDEGVVTKEATETSNGARLFTCTICKANKSEIIPAISADSAERKAQEASLNINGGDPQAAENKVPTSSATGTVDATRTAANVEAGVTAGNVNNKDDGSGWWLIPVSALVLVGTGAGAYYVMRKKGSQE